MTSPAENPVLTGEGGHDFNVEPPPTATPEAVTEAAFTVSGRHRGAGDLVAAVQANPGFWAWDFPLKYLELHIDTRDGAYFSLKDRDGNRIDPARVYAAIDRQRSRNATPAAGQEPEVTVGGGSTLQSNPTPSQTQEGSAQPLTVEAVADLIRSYVRLEWHERGLGVAINYRSTIEAARAICATSPTLSGGAGAGEGGEAVLARAKALHAAHNAGGWGDYGYAWDDPLAGQDYFIALAQSLSQPSDQT